jgi:hypothetical protein
MSKFLPNESNYLTIGLKKKVKGFDTCKIKRVFFLPTLQNKSIKGDRKSEWQCQVDNDGVQSNPFIHSSP